MTQQFTAYSDGSCDNLHPKRPGGAAYIIFDKDGQEVKRASKGFMGTSNNRMEILAIMSIVNSLPPLSSVTIYSDSQYSINVLSGKWKASENLDQIKRYKGICLTKNIKVNFVWVRGHNGNQYNELCDQMARNEYNKMRKTASKVKKKAKHLPSNVLEEQYYRQITTKRGRKKTKRK